MIVGIATILLAGEIITLREILKVLPAACIDRVIECAGEIEQIAGIIYDDVSRVTLGLDINAGVKANTLDAARTEVVTVEDKSLKVLVGRNCGQHAVGAGPDAGDAEDSGQIHHISLKRNVADIGIIESRAKEPRFLAHSKHRYMREI